jgi:hypothetical protein
MVAAQLLKQRNPLRILRSPGMQFDWRIIELTTQQQAQ